MPEEAAQNSGDSPAVKPPSTRGDALAVLKRLRDSGHVAYFAGGCVRDLLLGREPKDWDVATDAPPERVRSLFSNTQAVGAAFGVILVRHRGSVIEVATFRTEEQYLDGRHPTGVRFTTAEEDAKRRDFTINGLFLDPLRDGTLEAQVIDYVGGRQDLSDRLLRAIGDPQARFREDHLRMLRAVRFAARFELKIDEQTSSAIQHHANQIIRISPERIAQELRLMLTSSTRHIAWRLLEQFRLDFIITRFMQPGASGAPDTLSEGPRLFEKILPGHDIPFGLALAAAVLEFVLRVDAPRFSNSASRVDSLRQVFEHRAVQKYVRALRQALKISNEESDEVAGALEGLHPLLGQEPIPVAVMKRFLARPTAPLSRELLGALQPAGVLDEARAISLQAKLSQYDQTDVSPLPLITGDDLTAAGLSPGPAFKRVLDAVYDAQLEDRLTTRDAALKMALEVDAAIRGRSN